jgi:magnesium chelatase family protein
MNPCPCGFLTDTRKECRCTPSEVKRYTSKLSGPLLDHIDLHVEVPAVPYEDLTEGKKGERSADMAKRIAAIRDVQKKRYAAYAATNKNASVCRTNADLSGDMLETFCALDDEERSFLGRAVESLALSARAYMRILRIARTIADMEGEKNIAVPHIAEAVNCRFLDRQN